jgi:transposase
MSYTAQHQNDSIQATSSSTPESRSVANPNDPQVKVKRSYAPRRRFDLAYKQRILLAYNACTDASGRGALLRREGLYYARIAAWRDQLGSEKLKHHKQKTKHRTDHLLRENGQLKKKLAQAQAIIDLQKKVSDLLGTHILQQDSNEEN